MSFNANHGSPSRSNLIVLEIRSKGSLPKTVVSQHSDHLCVGETRLYIFSVAESISVRDDPFVSPGNSAAFRFHLRRRVFFSAACVGIFFDDTYLSFFVFSP